MSPSSGAPPGPLSRILTIHNEVDERARPLTVLHRARLRCRRGCSACCRDDLTVLEVEAQRIRAEYAWLLRETLPHPPGACAFLGGDGECRIYAARPYVCRTQGLPLRWYEEAESGDIEEFTVICELNLVGPPLTGLEMDQCWVIGPTEEALVDLQEELVGPLQRVALRELFARV